jgi:MFS family permease
MARAGRLLADVRPLRESPAFRRLWAGSTLSAVGGALTMFAVPLQVYDITRSPFAVGGIGVAQMIPTVTIGLLGGAIADAADRRRLVLVTGGCNAAISAGLAAQAFAGMRSVWLLYALVAASSSFSAISAPVQRTFIPSLLPADQLTAGLALNRLSFQIMLTTGPALAGLITAVPGLGLRACYLIDAASFAGSLYGVARLPALPRPAGAARPGPRAVAAGVRYIGRSHVLAGAFLADLNATVFGLPIALFPAINAERFGGDPRTLGLFTAAIGVGGLVSAALSGPVGRIARQGRAMLWAVAVWGAAFAGFAIASTLWLTLLMLAIAGAADTFTVVFRGTIVQQTTPDEFRGRVTAADYVVGASGGQLGNLEAGALGSLTSPTVSALAGGLITVAGAVVIGLVLPAFTRYQHPSRVRLARPHSPLSPGPYAVRAQRHDHAGLAGAVVAPRVVLVFRAEPVREHVAGVGLDLGVAADLQVAVRIGEIHDEQAASRPLPQVLDLLAGRVERQADDVVFGEEPHLRQLRPAVAAQGRERGDLGVEKVAVRGGNCHGAPFT